MYSTAGPKSGMSRVDLIGPRHDLRRRQKKKNNIIGQGDIRIIKVLTIFVVAERASVIIFEREALRYAGLAC